MKTKLEALIDFLGISEEEAAEEIEESRYDDNEFEYDPETYLVLTDREADEKFKEKIEDDINNIVFADIPKQYQSYFDAESYIKDVELSDGRGPTISSYDGQEHEESGYFIYRIG